MASLQPLLEIITIMNNPGLRIPGEQSEKEEAVNLVVLRADDW